METNSRELDQTRGTPVHLASDSQQSFRSYLSRRPLLVRSCERKVGRACPLCPKGSDVNLFCYGKGVVDFDPEVPDCAFDLGVAQQELHRPQVARPAVDQGGLGPSQGMRPEQVWVQSNAGDPF